MRSASAVALSPDSRMVAFTVSRTNWEDNAFESEIWISQADGSGRLRLSGGRKSSDAPVWSPDSRRLAFASDRDGKRQIYLISPAGGEAVLLTKQDNGVSAFEWMPGGSAILFSAPDPESDAQKERKKKFGDFAVVNGDYTYTHLWVVKVPPIEDPNAVPSKAERLTSGTALSVQDFKPSPDGRQVALAAVKEPNLSAEPADLYLLTVADKMLRPLVARKGPDTNPFWSPDGTRIAFVTANENPDYYYTNRKLAIVPVAGGPARVVSLTLDENINLLGWSPSGILCSANQKTSSHLFRVDPETGHHRRISNPDRLVLSNASFDRDYRRVAFIGSPDGSFPEVYTAFVEDFATTALTGFRDQWKAYRPATREVISWKSTDGTVIEGVLIKPPDFDANRKYPLLVVVHGGPTGIDVPVLSTERYYPIERFVAKGALVLRPNYRGSAGYGEKFRMLNVRNLGVGDSWDVLSGVDALIAKGFVDKDRLGCMGWSQGGYISAFLTTSSTRFKAISVGAGISNWVTYYVNTDIHPFTRRYLKATPWDDPQIYAKTSPITYIKQARTPTLIQHGEFDRRVPIPNAYELFQGLEDQGVPVRMYVYKGFGHGITKPKEMLAVLQHNYDFFSEYLWGEKPAVVESTSVK